MGWELIEPLSDPTSFQFTPLPHSAVSYFSTLVPAGEGRWAEWWTDMHCKFWVKTCSCNASPLATAVLPWVHGDFTELTGENLHVQEEHPLPAIILCCPMPLLHTGWEFDHWSQIILNSLNIAHTWTHSTEFFYSCINNSTIYLQFFGGF